MDNKLKSVFVSVFGISPKDINNDTTIENVENWDSLSHMNLIVALEEEFEIDFEEEEFVNMVSYAEIEKIITAKL
jgi:acyl carrier protein